MRIFLAGATGVVGRHGWARGADNRRAREELGWTPSRPSWRDGFTSRQDASS